MGGETIALVGALAAITGGCIWYAIRASKRAAAAEAILDSVEESQDAAREAEQELDGDSLSPDDLADRLRS